MIKNTHDNSKYSKANNKNNSKWQNNNNNDNHNNHISLVQNDYQEGDKHIEHTIAKVTPKKLGNMPFVVHKNHFAAALHFAIQCE